MKDFFRLFAFVGLVSVSSCGDSNPPQLIIDSPSDGDVFTIGDTLRISGNVTDDMLIDSLIFFTDGLFSGSLNLATVSNLMDIDFFTELTIDSTVIMQNYRLEAKAYDNDENETTTTVDFSVR
jgi:hypothetical protein